MQDFKVKMNVKGKTLPSDVASWNFSLIVLTNLNKPFVLFNSWINSLVSLKCGSQASTENYVKKDKENLDKYDKNTFNIEV